MSLQDTVSAERVHVAFFGMCNAGKSSLMNAVTAQDVSIVSPVPGTTTDPVKKAMELLPLGPVLLLDTPGLDDTGNLGALRVDRSAKILAMTDIAVLTVDAEKGFSGQDRAFLSELKERKIPGLVAFTKADRISDDVKEQRRREAGEDKAVFTSAVSREGIDAFKEALGSFAPLMKKEKVILADLVAPGSIVILVTPIDGSAPKGRLILPQQMTLRELLDYHCKALVCQPEELAETLALLKEPPAMVVTDSQAFAKVSKAVPESVPLTSFSILFARYKGNLKNYLNGANALDGLKPGDRVLIAEGCTHHRQCEDIGTVKIPAMMEKHIGFRPEFTWVSGGDYPQDLKPYALVVHCGGCMLTDQEITRRAEASQKEGVPMLNYGMAIAYMNGILQRSLKAVGLTEE
ncbi:MAG: [FeFe] hydrogenase H-cluster maturation GTPase HydF [Lachnospiraceae bacterium]|nr:[FeFe] hydrogenase H-cluster maturation GTPase HydF [Lachnospiraceae bacterium]